MVRCALEPWLSSKGVSRLRLGVLLCKARVLGNVLQQKVFGRLHALREIAQPSHNQHCVRICYIHIWDIDPLLGTR